MSNIKVTKEQINTLADTAPLMTSENYQERFVAEFVQLRIRRDKLLAMLAKWDAGNITFIPTCPRSLYALQVRAMSDYLAVLESRASIEGIDLPEC